jgi:NADH:ubiquinone oxidoreductase subunit F (NADH-binding)
MADATPLTGGAAPAASLTGPEAYHGAEMAGGKWSDAYSFVGDVFTAEKGFDPISRNFQSLVETFAGGAMPGSGAAAAGSGSAAAAPKQTAKEAALLKEYEAYTKSREMDIGGPPKRI